MRILAKMIYFSDQFNIYVDHLSGSKRPRDQGGKDGESCRPAKRANQLDPVDQALQVEQALAQGKGLADNPTSLLGKPPSFGDLKNLASRCHRTHLSGSC